MKTLKTTQDYINKVENNTQIVAVVFTQFNAHCNRCAKAIEVLKSIKKPAIPIFEFSAPQDAYPLNQLEINTVPTLVIFKNGKQQAEISGVDPGRMQKFYNEMIHVNY